MWRSNMEGRRQVVDTSWCVLTVAMLVATSVMGDESFIPTMSDFMNIVASKLLFHFNNFPGQCRLLFT
ncbi:hypothetical protein Pcinc_032506 [Petrolisthes cinctipes]|uniref:Uncharacterized protein n=1 Tax=Petrolisthes cinctipes TaxID=88211 RepID=A0AAE1K2X0_PETCI|nr:hypothetical protein Pcinc_032506 [Petrolisthes cinctipes]